MAESSDSRDAPGALEDALLAYLAAHPSACDTADGILEWWLQGSPLWALSELEETLERLVGAGTLLRLEALDGRVRYRRAPGRT